MHVHRRRRAAPRNRTLDWLWLHTSHIQTKHPWHSCVPHHAQPSGICIPLPSSPPSPSLSPHLLSSCFFFLSLFFSPALPLSPLFLFNFYFFCGAQGAAPGEHYFQKASSCIIVRIHALISWTIWQTAYAPSSLNALHLLIKWMSHCFQSNTLNLWASVCFHFLSQTRFFVFFPM